MKLTSAIQKPKFKAWNNLLIYLGKKKINRNFFFFFFVAVGWFGETLKDLKGGQIAQIIRLSAPSVGRSYNSSTSKSLEG